MSSEYTKFNGEKGEWGFYRNVIFLTWKLNFTDESYLCLLFPHMHQVLLKLLQAFLSYGGTYIDTHIHFYIYP